MAKSKWKNQLYFGDNLTVLRDSIADESVDLIYLDPPFNSKATYNPDVPWVRQDKAIGLMQLQKRRDHSCSICVKKGE